MHKCAHLLTHSPNMIVTRYLDHIVTRTRSHNVLDKPNSPNNWLTAATHRKHHNMTKIEPAQQVHIRSTDSIASITYNVPEPDGSGAYTTVITQIPLSAISQALRDHGCYGVSFAASAAMYRYEGWADEIGAIPLTRTAARNLMPKASKYYARVEKNPDDPHGQALRPVPCQAGHIAPYGTNTGSCVVCATLRGAAENLVGTVAANYKDYRPGLPSNAMIYAALFRALVARDDNPLAPVLNPLNERNLRNRFTAARANLAKGFCMPSAKNMGENNDPLPVVDLDDPDARQAAITRVFFEAVYVFDQIDDFGQYKVEDSSFRDGLWARMSEIISEGIHVIPPA